jgi:hypothetical protein
MIYKKKTAKITPKIQILILKILAKIQYIKLFI